VTAQTLLDSEVKAKTNKVSETDAQTFYNENKDRISGEFEQVKNQVVQYLQAREDNRALAQFAERLRRGATIQTFLTAPEPPTYNIATDDQPTKGNASATVTIVEFTDFQCPSCAQLHPVLEKLADEYADRVKFVIRDFPLAQHKQALKAAEAAEAAREQGKYWEYVALLFRNQKALETDKLKEYASQLSLDRVKFDQALDTGRFADKVQRDLQDGNKLGVNSTPTVFINGRSISDRSYEATKKMIDAALRNSTKK
jgi:protein-disulfide isomerase